MLHLYQSNRLESLAELFSRIQKINPLPNALQAEEIIVQSQGMRRYLTNYLAQELGVAANLKFSLPAGLTWRLMRELIPGIPTLSPFSSEVMRWRLLKLFGSEDFQTAEFAESRLALSHYLKSGQSADYQLAGQLADIFDQYLVYRPDWIDAWQAGKLFNLGEDEVWQAQLWRYLDNGNQHIPHRVALWEQLMEALNADVLPKRFFVFGIATLAPMYLQLLQKIAEHCDVFIFALNPSSIFWGNVIDATHVLQSPNDIDLTQMGHPLLASLGKQGRDFFDFLSEAECQTEADVFDEVLSEQQPTLLQHLQHDIQNLEMPAKKVADLLNDGSIKVVSAHSALRELQILKEHLLQVLHDHPDWQPHDIAVLTPNIEPYSPFIEAVFGQTQAGEQALPYSISDVKLSRRQPLFSALEKVLDLLESRFEVDKVWPILESELVLNRFELSVEDIPLLHQAISDLNVHWGVDKAMRHAEDNLFTWQQALERITLGWLLPENSDGMWQNISAWHSDINQLTVLSHFHAFMQTLFDTAQLWQQAVSAAEWVERIRILITALFQPESSDQYAVQQLEQSLAKWLEETELAQFGEALPQHTIILHIKRFLSSESQAGFLRRGITFCSMVPMRSLPFKVLCLLGLNDGQFPRNTKAAVFDLIARHPKKGDRARRDDDRYLFLEALISVREMLYLSYIGRNIRNDDELAPSTLLSELVDTIAAMTGHRSKDLMETWVVQHPLQAFSRRYFMPSEQDSDGISSLRQDYAEALSQPLQTTQPFFEQVLNDDVENEAMVSQSQFIHFWKNPLRAWLKKTLAWQEPYHDEAWESAEPFEPPVEKSITAAYVNARQKNLDFEDVAEKLKAESMLPAGELGSLWLNHFQDRAKYIDDALLRSEKLMPQAYEFEGKDCVLHGSLANVHQCGQIVFCNENPTNPMEIALILEHLIFNAVRPSELESYQTYIVKPQDTTIYPELPQETAIDLLKSWLSYYQYGQKQPLPFFAKTVLSAAKKYDGENWEQALSVARQAYIGSGDKNSKGQCEYTEVALVFGQNKVLPVETSLFRALIDNLFLPLIAAKII